MLRIVFLGSGAAMPSPESGTSCFALKAGSTFLFDCCEGAQRQMMIHKISYAKVKCVFISHLHADHFLGIFGLVQTLNMIGRAEPLSIFGPRGTKEFLESVFSLKHMTPLFPIEFHESDKKKKVYEDKLIRVFAFPVEHNCKALGYTIEEQPFRKFHEDLARSKGIKGRLFSELLEKGSVEVNGKKIKAEDVTFLREGKRIVYSGDTLACKSVEKEAKGADLLIHDSTFSDSEKQLAKEKFHATAKQAAELAKKAGAKKLVLTHFSNRYDKLEVLLLEAKAVFQDTDLAKEGLEFLV